MKKKFLTIVITILLLAVCATCLVCCKKTENISLENGNFVFEKICDKVLDSCVKITCGEAGGSGVIVSEDGYIITNDHVVENSKKATIQIVDKTSPDKYFTYEADIIEEVIDKTEFEKMDLALLKITEESNPLKKKFTPAQISAEEVNFGDYGVMVGNPKQLGILCEKAMVANPKVLINDDRISMNYIALDAPVNTGNSGGGFFDASGSLAGIVTLRQYDDSDSNANVVFGIGYAIPSSYVKSYLARYGL